MSLIAKDTGQGDYQRLEAGLYQAVCSHVINLGLQATPFGEKYQCCLCFELKEKMSDGRPWMQSQIYTLSLNEKAKLRQHLEQWRGKQFTMQELQGFDLEILKGVNCMLSLVEKQVGDNVYTNIASVSKLMQGLDKIEPIGQEAPEWIRKKVENQLPQPEAEDMPNAGIQDEGQDQSLPF